MTTERDTMMAGLIAWEETAAQFQRNADYYRGLVVQIGEMLGPDAYISDDGSVQDSVLCAKVPELVAKALAGMRLSSDEGVICSKCHSTPCSCE